MLTHPVSVAMWQAGNQKLYLLHTALIPIITYRHSNSFLNTPLSNHVRPGYPKTKGDCVCLTTYLYLGFYAQGWITLVQEMNTRCNSWMDAHWPLIHLVRNTPVFCVHFSALWRWRKGFWYFSLALLVENFSVGCASGLPEGLPFRRAIFMVLYGGVVVACSCGCRWPCGRHLVHKRHACAVQMIIPLEELNELHGWIEKWKKYWWDWIWK